MSPTLKLLTKTKDEMVPNMERISMPAGSSIFQMIRREIEDEETFNYLYEKAKDPKTRHNSDI